MKVVYSQDQTGYNLPLITAISNQCGVSKDTAYLLTCRGIDKVNEAKKFLSPGKQNFQSPFLLNGVEKATQRIIKAKDNKESLLIFGDYDADGVCATTILYNVLKQMGIVARTIVPERDDGYGLNLDIVLSEHQKQKIDLLITVDCGICDKDKIEILNSHGIEVIVTDHHEPPLELPSCIAINPKIPNQRYDFNGLCGAGVAYKLSYALMGELANEQLDLVALATVSDSMDLIKENRDLVYEGLKLFNTNLRPCFKHVLGDISKEITAQTLAYTIAPRINAGGRMGDALCSLKLLLSDNEAEIFDLSVKLNAYNIERQTECDRIYKQAKEQILQNGLYNDSVILVKDENWKTGFVGIVSSKLVEDYSRPAIVFAGQGEMLKGSARSVDQINIYNAISMASDLLEGFGGHSQAAGVTVSKSNFEAFRAKLNSYVKENYALVEKEKTIFVDLKLTSPLTMKFAKELERLEPFGVANRKPLFSVIDTNVRPNLLKAGSPHLSFTAGQTEMLYFNASERLNELKLPLEKVIIFEYNLSTFRSKEYLKGYVKAVISNADEINQCTTQVFEQQLDQLAEVISQGETPFNSENLVHISEYKTDSNYQTLYVLTNPENYVKAKLEYNLPIDLFTVQGKDLRNRIAISPKEIPSGYTSVVYLDKPINPISTQVKSYVLNSDMVSYIDLLVTDRCAFTETFTLLLQLVGKQFINVRNAYEDLKDKTKLSSIQFIFCYKVFVELGFFSEQNGILVRNANVKNELTNSKIYNAIKLLKD